MDLSIFCCRRRAVNASANSRESPTVPLRAGAASPSTRQPNCPATKDAAADVVILGAGFAGLACALRLKDAGLRCTVLEARQRPGGRALSVDNGGGPLELGAEFVHGEKVATWRYMTRFGLSGDARGCSKTAGASVLADGGNYVFVDGVLHPPSAVNGQPNRLFFEAIEEAGKEWVAQGGTGAISVAELVQRREKDIFPQPPSEEERRLCHGMMAEWYGGDLAEVSLFEDCPCEEVQKVAGLERALLAEDGDEGHWRVREGYSVLAERMASELDVRYSHEVQEVAWSERGVTVSAKVGGEKASLCAAQAVIALPLACLQQGDVIFTPALPDDKREAIDTMGSGPVAKVILHFAEAFWPEDLQFLFTPFSVQLWWPGGGTMPCLTGYLGGSTDIGKLLDRPDEEVVKEALAQLCCIFPKLPKLEKGRVVAWHREPWCKMGYSFLRMGAPPAARLRLRERTGALLWAGEAAHPTKASSVHGALETGEHAARQALEQLYIFVDLREERPELLERVYAELLETHFPVDGELDDLEDMREGLSKGGGRSPELHILVAMQGEDLAACACYEYYPGGDFVLMSYLCVAAPYRKHGLARVLLRRAEAQVQQRTGGQQPTLFAETHAAGVEDGVMDPAARQEVLAALGFRCLRFAYVQPPLSDHHEPCGGLRLLVRDRESLPADAVVSYLDEFAGSVCGWDDSWKEADYYTAQVQELKALGEVEAQEARPW